DFYTRKFGFRKIEATVKTTNEAALQVYLDYDFEIEGLRKEVAFVDGAYCDEYHIAKHLDKTIWLPPNIQTDRLLLRPITIKDAENIYEYTKLSEVSTYTLWDPHKSLQDTKKWIRSYVKNKYLDNQFEPYG